MKVILQPWQLLVVEIAGWLNREQQEVIEFYRDQLNTLLELQGKKRILLNDTQRIRLAVKAKALGRKTLNSMTTIVTPDTLLRWHRSLVAAKWDYSDKRQKIGRPRIRQEIVDLTLKFARENPHWGCDTIRNRLANIGYKICDTTVENILKSHGIEPAPERFRQGSWSMFLKSHWDTLAAIDFTTVEVWTRHGLTTYYLLFVIELNTRRVELAGITVNPDELWMKRIALNLTDTFDGFLNGKTHLIMDRDTKFSGKFRVILDDAGTESVMLPPRSPNLNAYIERFMRSIKEDCLNRLIFFGEKSLRKAVKEYLAYYHHERNHQGLDNRIIAPDGDVGRTVGEIKCRERLGGLLKHYYRDAA